MFRKVLSILWCILCTLTNLYHVYHLSDQYFKYETTTDVQLFIPEFVKIPKVSLCFDMEQTVNLEKLSDQENDFKDLTDYDLIREALHNVSRFNSSRLFQISLTPQDIIKEISLTYLSGKGSTGFRYYSKHYYDISNKDLQNFTKIKRFWNDDNCLSIEMKNNYSSLNFKELWREYDGYFIGIDIPKNEIRNAYLFTTNKLDSISLGSHSYRTLNLPDKENTPMEHFLTTTTFESYLLEPPYKTNCFNYHGITRTQCLNDCVKNSSISRVNKVPHLCVLYPHEDYNLIDKDSFMKTNVTSKDIPQGSLELKRELFEFCNKVCSRIECWSSSLIPVVRSSNPIDGSNSSSIQVYASHYPVTMASSQPATHVVTFLTNLFSTFGFWLGLSVLTSLSSLKPIFMKKRVSKPRHKRLLFPVRKIPYY